MRKLDLYNLDLLNEAPFNFFDSNVRADNLFDSQTVINNASFTITAGVYTGQTYTGNSTTDKLLISGLGTVNISDASNQLQSIEEIEFAAAAGQIKIFIISAQELDNVAEIPSDFLIDGNANGAGAPDTLQIEWTGTIASTINWSGWVFQDWEEFDAININMNGAGTTLTSTSQSETINAGAGNDAINSGDGSDTINGGDGNDTVEGGAGGDTLDGGLGIDTLSYAGSSAGVMVNLQTASASGGDAAGDIFSNFENLTGSAFNDTLTGSSGSNVINAGAGADTINIHINAGGVNSYNGDAGIDLIDFTSFGPSQGFNVNLGAGTLQFVATGVVSTITGIENINAGAGNDVLTGDTTDNVINGGLGNDTLISGGGNDTLNGNDDNDILMNDGDSVTTMNGGAGDDRLIFNGFNIDGSSSDGGTGTDTLDISFFDFNRSFVYLDSGIWYYGLSDVTTLVNIENVIGSQDADYIVGTSGVNVLNGGTGDDIIEGGAGGDMLDGGVGTDTLSYADAGAAIAIHISNGTGSVGNAAGDTFSNFENFVGSNFNDSFFDWGQTVTVEGGDGNDHFQSQGGTHTYFAGWGNDRYIVTAGFAEVGSYIDGGAGADSLYILGNGTEDFTDDTIIFFEILFFQGDAFDIGATFNAAQFMLFQSVIAAAHVGNTRTISIIMDSVTNLDLSGTKFSGFTEPGDRVTITGDPDAEMIAGSSVHDVIISGAGDDIIEGGAGADTMDGGAGIDTLSYAGSSAGVTVNLATGTASGGDAVGDVFSNFESLLGSAFDDILRGDAVANTLTGGLGIDRLFGENGDDFLFGNEGNDILFGGNGIDDLRGGDGNDTIRGDDGNDIMRGGLNNDVMYGGLDDDVMYGDAGFDNMLGQAGNDIMFGGGNDDNMSGGNGDDRMFAGAGDDDMVGGAGNDRLVGQNGNDMMIAGAGNDVLVGGNGADEMWGGTGNDRFISQAGNDVLVFEDTFGNDIWNDFEDGIDLMDFSNNAAVNSMADLAISQAGTHVRIENGADSILLLNTSLADIDATDFVF